MYRGFVPRYIFLPNFSKKTAKKFIFGAIFAPAAQNFASWSALLRARFHTRPPAGTSAAKSRSVRPAACSARRSWNLETPATASRIAPHSRLTASHLAALSQTALALICALTRSTTRTPHRSTLPSPPRHKSARRSSTTDQKPYALLDLHRLTQPPNHPSS